MGAGVLWLGEVPGGNSVTVSYRFPLWSAFGGGLRDVYFEEVEKQRKHRVVEVEKVKKLGKKRVFVVESCGRSIPRGSICRGVKRGKKLGE